ncbi:hypothetical protein CHS0354_001533 [Potamilus streckersoni]|uniref:Uncharacterized protein n=1 Tax=Potamilus streckersoni TaxID=2493646 RepID=A0AAE0SML6_9BIVA|nr:hypothetical protein CHS0354_001533 [Potamilus streckersoni]
MKKQSSQNFQQCYQAYGLTNELEARYAMGCISDRACNVMYTSGGPSLGHPNPQSRHGRDLSEIYQRNHFKRDMSDISFKRQVRPDGSPMFMATSCEYCCNNSYCNKNECIIGYLKTAPPTTHTTTLAPTTPKTTKAPITIHQTNAPTTHAHIPTTHAPITPAPTSASTKHIFTNYVPTIAPTTPKPTTHAPITPVPTLSSTTQKLTTHAPTTHAPTNAPTTSKPTTHAPITPAHTSASTTVKQTTHAPTTSAPSTTSTHKPTPAPTTQSPTTKPTTPG